MDKKQYCFISSRNWLERNVTVIDELKTEYDIDFITTDSNNPNFSYIVMNELFIRKDVYALLINDRFPSDKNFIKRIMTEVQFNSLLLYSNNLKDYDFSKINNDLVICFSTNLIKQVNNTQKFQTFLQLQKHIISKAQDSKFTVNIINEENLTPVQIETNEFKLVSTFRKNRGINKEKIEKTKKVRNRGPVRIIDVSLDPKVLEDIRKNLPERPRILMITDVKAWAWWIKSEYIKKYLEPYYDIELYSILDKHKGKRIDYKAYNLYFTYGYSYVVYINQVKKEKRISGVTAHRPLNELSQKLYRVAWTHANSVLLYKDLKTIHPNCYYTPNGVDEHRFKPLPLMPGNREMVFGHVGKLSPRKGQKEFLEPSVLKANVPYYHHYNNHASKIPHNKMPGIYNNLDIMMVSSMEDGTPCPALEAAACGRPIISNRIGNMPELVETYKTGILLDKLDVDLYVDAIKWCQSNPDKVIEMGKNIRAKVESEWTWELMSKNYLYFFDQILGIVRDPILYNNPAMHHIEGL